MKSSWSFFTSNSDDNTDLPSNESPYGERQGPTFFPETPDFNEDEISTQDVLHSETPGLKSASENEPVLKPVLKTFQENNSDFFSEMRQHANILLSSLDLRERQTGEHSRRVALLAVALGEKLGLNAEDLALLQCGALLHDIGKVGVPDDVLLKATELTKEDWEEIREHPIKGANLLKLSPTLLPLSEIVLRHHERFDGGGYPGGLLGTEIPYLARIVSVVDAYEVMTSNRVYKTARTETEAKNQLLEQRGTQFDPEIIDVFMGLQLE